MALLIEIYKSRPPLTMECGLALQCTLLKSQEFLKNLKRIFFMVNFQWIFLIIWFRPTTFKNITFNKNQKINVSSFKIFCQKLEMSNSFSYETFLKIYCQKLKEKLAIKVCTTINIKWFFYFYTFFTFFNQNVKLVK